MFRIGFLQISLKCQAGQPYIGIETSKGQFCSKH